MTGPYGRRERRVTRVIGGDGNAGGRTGVGAGVNVARDIDMTPQGRVVCRAGRTRGAFRMCAMGGLPSMR